jgi:choline dehydrogenase-like flavoprotein
LNELVRRSDAIIQGRTLTRDLEEHCDAVVVGSGAGGAVVATILAEAGFDVIVLEEGAYYAPEEYADFSPSQALRRLGRESGMLAALGIGQTPIIALMAGRCVGGSSVMTGGVCFRIPEVVHDHWSRELGLNELSQRAFEPAYQDVERRCNIELVPPHMHSEATLRMTLGAKRLGIEFRPLHRNTRNCQGLSMCTFGCPAKAKLSVDVAYLPRAMEYGARVVSDALAERVIVERGRAAGVEGRLKNGPLGEPGQRLRIRAPIVVAACGTIHTPGLLQKSGIGKKHPDLGRHITLHPATRIGALFDDRVIGWNGAMQSVYSEHFQDEGITLVGVYSAANVLAASLPGMGPSLRRRVEQLPRLGLLGAMVHDEGGGSVRPGFRTREPFFTYEMAGRDLARLRRSLTILSEIAFSAGARQVYLPIFGCQAVNSVDEARRIERMPMDARRIECMAFHPLGSARMSNDPRGGVVSQSGESFEVPGLFIADGSVLPSSIGVNSQQAVMTMATRIAWRIRERRPS